MANNDDNSRRNRDRPEDNPFIAFRRFADAQVSSLLNTVFTLPATIANHHNVHQAREACLFKKADQASCDKLKEIEDDISGLRHEGRELYRVGDLQEVMKNIEKLMKLDREADELRDNIVGQSNDGPQSQDEKALIQKVANKKGQEWGWDWSWGFPKPFDDDGTRHSSRANESWTSMEETRARYRKREQELVDELAEEARTLLGDLGYNDAFRATVEAVDSSPALRGLLGEQAWAEYKRAFGFEEKDRDEDLNQAGYSPRTLDANVDMRKTGINWREAYQDLLSAENKDDEATNCPWRGRRRAQDGYPKRVPWADEETNDEPSYEYSHDHEDQHDDPPTPEAKQGHFEPAHKYDSSQEASDDQHIHKFLLEQQEKEGRQLGLADPFDTRPCQRSNANATSEAETELDVYEQMREKTTTSENFRAEATAPVLERTSEVKPSILSTLTTTERTVAPDGSVTTKVVLKKRFADGREESSETVHTQRGQESNQSSRDPWQEVHSTAISANGKTEERQQKPKKGGWFWSS
ncbi:hypothetical protein FB567DRAFT_533107 [Paraphoma chrysanthemicola]|uniref:Uncharacterized protein n=1 Tax=Paraphoma chrysanthemicola TaxID=798071 RepID=A0A8K0R0A7_9PLEO|nr:hypothetical protein FB567DRAFT_533107 [Paraphoma chrysanthemicola]